MLAAFQRDAIAALGPHVFGGAYAVIGVYDQGLAAVFPADDWVVPAALDTACIGFQPAFNDAVRAGVQCQLHFSRSMGKRLQGAFVVLRADHDKRCAAGVKGMQVQQHIMRLQQRAQHIGDARFVVLRNRAGSHVAVEVAIADPLAFGKRQRVGHRHKAHGAARDG